MLYWDFCSGRQTGSYRPKSVWNSHNCVPAGFFLFFSSILASSLKVKSEWGNFCVFMVNKWVGFGGGGGERIKIRQEDYMSMGLACSCRQSTKGRN